MSIKSRCRSASHPCTGGKNGFPCIHCVRPESPCSARQSMGFFDSVLLIHHTGLRLNHCFSSLRLGRMSLPLRGRWPSEARSDEVVSLLLFCAQYLIRRLRATPSPRGKAGAGLPESSSQRYALDGNEYKIAMQVCFASLHRGEKRIPLHPLCTT